MKEMHLQLHHFFMMCNFVSVSESTRMAVNIIVLIGNWILFMKLENYIMVQSTCHLLPTLWIKLKEDLMLKSPDPSTSHTRTWLKSSVQFCEISFYLYCHFNGDNYCSIAVLKISKYPVMSTRYITFLTRYTW